ncbi:RodZ domain-containing protein [Psychromonas sp. KJ10-10]|uniref:RodZ domain-containing protein n=1 Tax=Psychromonas sp. KJ10-10 TaxID=3391823 RepID=UPI0039B5F64D
MSKFPSVFRGCYPLGKALQSARVSATLSIEDVAKKLNLGVVTIGDLEENLEQIIESKKYPVIYLRGYLSNYAKLVGLGNLEEYAEYQLINTAQKQKQTLKSSNLIIPRTKKRSKFWPIFILLILLIALPVYFFQAQVFNALGLNLSTSEPMSGLTSEDEFKEDLAKKLLIQSAKSSQSETTDVAEAVESNEPVQQTQALIQTEAPQSSDVSSDISDSESNSVENAPLAIVNDIVSASDESQTQVEEMVVALDSVLESDVEQDDSADGAPENLSLVFNGECWTEVYDATGERIAFGLYTQGRELMLSGMAPFKLKLGDPSAVEIQYQDQVIEGDFTPGRSAQFTVPLT